MEVTDENLATLANYLQQTLNPDPNVRRPGKYIQAKLMLILCFTYYYLLLRNLWVITKKI